MARPQRQPAPPSDTFDHALEPLRAALDIAADDEGPSPAPPNADGTLLRVQFRPAMLGAPQPSLFSTSADTSGDTVHSRRPARPGPVMTRRPRAARQNGDAQLAFELSGRADAPPLPNLSKAAQVGKHRRRATSAASRPSADTPSAPSASSRPWDAFDADPAIDFDFDFG